MLTECNSNDSPWLLCLDCIKAGKCKLPVPELVLYGHITTHSVTGQQFFYRHPEIPYLDNAKECIRVYAYQ